MGRGATRADCCALTSGSPRVLQTMTKQPVEEVVIERILEFGDAVTRTVIVSNDRLWSISDGWSKVSMRSKAAIEART